MVDLIREEIEEKFNDSLLLLDNEDKFYHIELNSLKTEQLSSLEAANNFEKKKRNSKRKLKLVDLIREKTKLIKIKKLKV